MNHHQELHPHSGSWLREIVFGLNDGLVTTLVFILAVKAMPHSQIILVAFGELIAGGVSMGLGGFLSARTNQEVLAKRVEVERLEIKQEPEEERAELRAIYQGKGLDGPLLERVVDHLTADEERWLQALVRDELGIIEDDGLAPWHQGLLVGMAFMAGAFMPIVPFISNFEHPVWWAYAFAAIITLLLGTIKSKYTLKSPIRNGLEFLAIVTLGTIAGLAISLFLHT
jgi:VIT1/CCC1 family predicted Fe2+/Mn2+ transporter